MRRKQPSAFANPVLIGAVTVLVLLVAVFLAYNANEGLPFVPTRELKVDIANGSELVAGNDVREGGYLIGIVSATEAGDDGERADRRAAHAQAEQGLRRGPDRLERLDPAAVGARAEVPRPAQGDLEPHVRRRRDAAGVADERAGPVRRRVQDVRRQDPGRGRSRTWSGSATRSPRAGRRSTTRSRACRRCSGTSSRSPVTCPIRAPS